MMLQIQMDAVENQERSLQQNIHLLMNCQVKLCTHISWLIAFSYYRLSSYSWIFFCSWR
jgi:hypothetical protein